MLVPIYDETTSRVIGYQAPALDSAITVDEDVITKTNVSVDSKGNKVATIEAKVYADNVAKCQEYKVFATMKENGQIKTGYNGNGCGKDDPTHEGNLYFVPGTQVKILPTKESEKMQHENANTVIVIDAILKPNVNIGNR